MYLNSRYQLYIHFETQSLLQKKCRKLLSLKLKKMFITQNLIKDAKAQALGLQIIKFKFKNDLFLSFFNFL